MLSLAINVEGSAVSGLSFQRPCSAGSPEVQPRPDTASAIGQIDEMATNVPRSTSRNLVCKTTSGMVPFSNTGETLAAEESRDKNVLEVREVNGMKECFTR